MPDKEINKAEMARRIFADAGLLKKINELVHPAVNRYILDEIERERKAGEKEFFVLESALLLENGYDKILDSMWYIYCNESVRAQRLKASRGYSDEKIRSIMSKQVSEEQFRKVCDVVIDNSGELEGKDGALAQVDAAIERIRRQFS
jgi:dephospho-CoA kinase